MRDLWHEGTQFRRWQEYLKRASRQGGFTDESDLLGKERIFQLTFNQLQSDNGLRGISIFARDITNQRAAQEAINRLAFFDTLTQLPNRRLLLDRLRQAMLQSERHKRFAAVLFVDLDRFKILNDTRGHEVGDMLLIEVAQRLQSTVREGDTVARHGGDEFIVLINGIGDHLELAARNAEVICQKILHALSQPFDLMGETHRISASIGARPFLGQDHSIDDLLRTADTA
ncbi:MAG: GGDEF domain-containing protein, partial [Candidatus Accumulibacter sp.]|nr:GGDEF domain-containing protein [Accumulibacter sp.]